VLFNFDENEWLTESSLPVIPLEYVNLDGITGKFLFNNAPVLYGKSSGPIAYINDGNLCCDVDLFGGIFFLLSLYEEVVIKKYDEYGRFSYLESILFKSKLYSRPVVNEYLEILKALLHRAGFSSITDTRQYQFTLSHDVDVPFSYDAKASQAAPGQVEKNPKDYRTYRVSFSTSGQYNQFLIFLKEIEKNLRLVDIISVQLKTKQNEGGGTAQMQEFKIELQAYWLSETYE
jgi:hypothetical protein